MSWNGRDIEPLINGTQYFTSLCMLRISTPDFTFHQWKSDNFSHKAIYLRILLETSPQRTCEADAADENSSFIFTVYVKSVSLYYFKLAYVVLHMAVKEVFDPPSKMGEISRLNWFLLIESF